MKKILMVHIERDEDGMCSERCNMFVNMEGCRLGLEEYNEPKDCLGTGDYPVVDVDGLIIEMEESAGRAEAEGRSGWTEKIKWVIKRVEERLRPQEKNDEGVV